MAKRKLDGKMDEFSADYKIRKSNAAVFCEKSGGQHLAELGFMAGWQKEFRRGLKLKKLAVDQIIQFSSLFSQGTVQI